MYHRHDKGLTDQLPDPPDHITIADFLTTPNHGRHPVAESRNPFTCGLTGKTFTLGEANDRRESLARALGKRLGWLPNEETEWDKVACMFSFNTVRMHAWHGAPPLLPRAWRPRAHARV